MHYLHVGGREPPELETVRLIEVFGSRAVLGDRTLGLGEMRSVLAVQAVKRLYAEWMKTDQRLIWESDHPEFAAMLDELELNQSSAEQDHADA